MLSLLRGSSSSQRETLLKEQLFNAEEARENTQAIVRVIQDLEKSDHVASAVSAALERIRSSFNWDYGSYWTLDTVERVLRFQSESGNVSHEFKEVTKKATFAKGIGLVGRAWQNNAPVFIEDLTELRDCCRREPAAKAGIKSGIAIPVILNGETVGVIDFLSVKKLVLSEQRLETLAAIVNLLSVSINRIEKEAFKEAERLELAENIKVLNSILDGIRSAKSKSSAAQVALSQICKGFGWRYASFWEVDPEENTLVFSTDYGALSEEFSTISQQVHFQKGQGLNGHTWQTAKVHFVEDLTKVKDCPRAVPAKNAGIRSAISLPVFVNGKVGGTMDFLTTQVLKFSPARLQILSALAQIVSNTIERFENVDFQVHAASEISTTLSQATHSLDELCQDILVNSEEAANQTQTLSSASEEVNVSFNEVAHATEEMSASISEISKNMHQAAEITNKAEAIGRNTKGHVDRLANSAKEVYTIVELIKGIASQTNLLSLNATIEASTAGEAGKGFAVVANEVKELAKQSAEAADQIRNQVTDIQNNIANTIHSINEITAIVSEMSTINNVVATAVEEQSYTTSEISRSLNGILLGVKEITKSIIHVAKISTKTSENAKNSHQATGEIARMSEKLKMTFAKLHF